MKAIEHEFDVVVAGGGIAGISAAVKASGLGRSVLLIEKYCFPGGMSTAGMVSPFMKHSIGGKPLVQGVFKSLEDEMRSMNGMIDNGFYADSFRTAALHLLTNSGCHTLFNCEIAGVNRNGDLIESVDVFCGGKSHRINGKVFIDTTGDAQLVYLGNFPWKKGDETTGKLQAMTLFFRMAGIDMVKAAEYVSANKNDFLEWMSYDFDLTGIISVAGYFSNVKKAVSEGRLSPGIEYIFFTTLPEKGEASFNTTNILELDASYSEDLTRAEVAGRKQAYQIAKILINEIPGFSDSFILETAAQVGVRETRRAIGEYVITGEDIKAAHKFHDSVARGCYGIDIHGQKDEKCILEHLAEGEFYEIPLRALIVAEAQNLLAAGRGISSTRQGHSALRIMPTSAATGEACGALAALSVQMGESVRSINYKLVQNELTYNLTKKEK